jgi:RNAse (barnase) inhibitor barstar
MSAGSDSGPGAAPWGLRAEPPWLAVLVGDDAMASAIAPVAGAGGAVRRLRGRRMRTDAALFAEFNRTLDFPDYFGRNWPALEDCLIDLAWLPAPAYLLAVEDSDQVLAQEPDERVGLFADLLVRVARTWAREVAGVAWARPAVPFHLLLHVRSASTARALTARWSAAGVGLPRATDPPSP